MILLLKKTQTYLLLTLFFSLSLFSAIASGENLDDKTPLESGINFGATQNALQQFTLKDSIKTCYYKPNAICKIDIRERMPIIIKLPEGEWIEDYILGDEINFEVETFGVSKSAISLRSYYSGVDTSLNIIGGSGFIYPFYVKTDAIGLAKTSDFIVNIKADDTVLKKITQAQHLYKDHPTTEETLDDKVLINIKNSVLSTTFKKILPKGWSLNIDKALQSRERLIDVVAQNQTRRQIITDLATDLKLKVIFYSKLKLLVITALEQVIE